MGFFRDLFGVKSERKANVNCDELCLKGSIFIKQKRLDEAISCFEKVLEIDTNNVHALASMGEILIRKNMEYDTAVGYFDRALKIDSSSQQAAVVWCNKGLVLMQVKRYDEAMECVVKC